MIKRNNLIFLSLAVLLTLPALWGIFHPGFFISDDGNWMVIRFSAFYENLRSGQFPVRFLSRLNNGFGYPVADFLYPLFMYIGVPIKALGVDFVTTIKIILASSMIASSVFAFLWLRKVFDSAAALVGSLAYVLFPYHLWDLYKRGSVGEILALAIIPFILWSIERGSLLFSALGYGFLILAHNSLALIFVPILFVYQIIKTEGTKTMRSLKAIELGLAISAFFWLPALYDKQYVIFDQTTVSDFGRYFVMDYSLLGLVTLVALVGSLLFLKNKDKRLIYFFIITVLAVFISTSPSRIVWENLPMVGFIQFPFRFLSVVILGASFLFTYQINSVKKELKYAVVLAYVAVIFYSAWPFIFPQQYQYHPDTFYSTNQDTTTVKNEYMPKWVEDLPQGYESKLEVLDGEEKLNILRVNPNKIEAQGYFADGRMLQVNTVYFPGWQVFVDGESVPVNYSSGGLIRFRVPSGNHTILVKFGETGVRTAANVISASALIVILFLLVSKYRKL